MSEDCPHCVFEKTEANCRGCFEGSHYKPKPITNADRIRSMSDEELATWLNTMQSNAWHSGRMQKTPNKYPSTNQTWLDWLKQEATDDETD